MYHSGFPLFHMALSKNTKGITFYPIVFTKKRMAIVALQFALVKDSIVKYAGAVG